MPTVLEAARGFRGAKWRHRGRKPWALDCVGLVLLSFRAAGKEIVDADFRYGREPWDAQLRAEVQKRLGVPVVNPQPEDVALIRYARGQPLHLALVGDKQGLSLIHIHSLKGLIEHPFDPAQVVEVYRWRG